jgi:hypothetical protein
MPFIFLGEGSRVLSSYAAGDVVSIPAFSPSRVGSCAAYVRRNVAVPWLAEKLMALTAIIMLLFLTNIIISLIMYVRFGPVKLCQILCIFCFGSMDQLGSERFLHAAVVVPRFLSLSKLQVLGAEHH